jgi:7-carboxy-7-deazaguanine synthase
MKINEIFYSIQGEGKWMGLPNIFIRTTGCNLRCSFCDTTYAYETGEEMSIEEIINRIRKHPCNYVCITGGEPLLQEAIVQLIDVLLEKKYVICLETNGSIGIESLVGKKSLLISLDIKCPSSTMHEKMNFNNVSLLTCNDQLKFIIQNREDYEYAKKIIKKYKPQSAIFFQPVWGINLKELSSWVLNDGLDVRIGLQLHKIIWGDGEGV